MAEFTPAPAPKYSELENTNTSVTGGGMTLQCYRYGNVVTVHCSGSISATNADTTIVTLPVGYRPNREVVFSGWNNNWSSGLKPLYFNSDGQLRCKTSLVQGGLYGTCTFVCPE